jgi:hypothetical protein
MEPSSVQPYPENRNQQATVVIKIGYA